MDILLLSMILTGSFVLLVSGVIRLLLPVCSQCRLILPVSGTDEKLEWKIRGLFALQSLLPYPVEISILDCGMDRETAAIAAHLQRQYPSVTVLDATDPKCFREVRRNGTGRKSDPGDSAGNYFSEPGERIQRFEGSDG